MPRPTLPLTPASSTEIAATERLDTSPDLSFILPPPAKRHAGTVGASHRPIQPATVAPYSLPPPPTRSRTIIQMTPHHQPQKEHMSLCQPSAQAQNKRGKPAASQGAKKQPSSTSVAGKKIARKTAHSVIERRRRSKMNEEFDTLKSLIPACNGQEMHKLAILQASIDYLRYLEGCIIDLKAANNALSTPLLQAKAPRLRESDDLDDRYEDEDASDQDSEMEDNDRHLKGARRTVQSPIGQGKDRKDAVYDTPESMTTSPTFKPHHHHSPKSSNAVSVSSLPSPTFGSQASPTITPNTGQDVEATELLLSLNKDRRFSTSAGDGRRGMSVRDLLSP